jgi:hypothetical protein
VSQATLCLRGGEFTEAADLATNAAEILELKSPGRAAEIALAYMRAGEANNLLRRYPEALQDLKKAEAYFSPSPEPIPPARLRNLELLLRVAQNGIARQ